MTKLTIAGLIDFVCSQDPAKPINDLAWSDCAIGDYAKTQGVTAEWGATYDKEWTDFRNFVALDVRNVWPVWYCFSAEYVDHIQQPRTYGDLQQDLIQAKLVADPKG